MLDALRAELGAAMNLLSALGPKPKGDPTGILRLANDLEDLAARARTAAAVSRDIPSTVVFIAPAASSMKAYASDAAGGLLIRATALDTVAEQARAAADRIQQAQDEYDLHRRALESAVTSLIGAVRRLA